MNTGFFSLVSFVTDEGSRAKTSQFVCLCYDKICSLSTFACSFLTLILVHVVLLLWGRGGGWLVSEGTHDVTSCCTSVYKLHVYLLYTACTRVRLGNWLLWSKWSLGDQLLQSKWASLGIWYTLWLNVVLCYTLYPTDILALCKILNVHMTLCGWAWVWVCVHIHVWTINRPHLP